MALENVIEDIIKQANATAQKIVKEAEEEAEQIVSKSSVEVERQIESFDEETRKLLEEKRNSEILMAKIGQKRMLLSAKKMVTDRILNEIKQKITKIAEKERESILKTLVEKAKHNLKDAKYVYSNSDDKKIVEKLGLNFADTINCYGGIIVENSDRSVRVNLTFDRLFTDFKEKLNEDITKIF